MESVLEFKWTLNIGKCKILEGPGWRIYWLSQNKAKKWLWTLNIKDAKQQQQQPPNKKQTKKNPENTFIAIKYAASWCTKNKSIFGFGTTEK